MLDRTRVAALAAAVVLVHAGTAPGGDVYRCRSRDGHISYQQIPCSPDSRPLELDTRRSGWSALRPGEKRLLERYRERDAARRREPPERASGPDRQAVQCRKRRSQLEAVRTRLRRGYRIGEGEALHRKQADHEDYLRTFCS